MHHPHGGHRVLHIPELLDMIFSFLDLTSNASNARVCKAWCDVALDTLWKDVDDLYRLFSILAPMRSVDEEYHPLEYMFSRPPESSDWKRFELYSRRVRRLCYKPSDFVAPNATLAQSAFDEIARTRTSFAILPNMHTLEWEGPISLCVLFMHNNVRRLTLRLPLVPDTSSLDMSVASLASDSSETPQRSKTNPFLGSFFTEISDRMPFLSYLNIKISFPISRIESDVVQLLLRLQKLKKIEVPRYCVTTEIMNALSRLEFLGCIEFQYLEDQGWGSQEDMVNFKPTLEEGAFPALGDLALTVNYGDFTRFIDAPYAPRHLQSLYLDSHFFEAPEVVKSLLISLSETCQLLQSLALMSRVDVPNGDLDLDPADEQCLSWDSIKPLLNFPCLTSFELVHGNPLYIDQSHVEELAEKWPNLETLMLNNEPGFFNHTSLGLEALIPFARHCPRLKHLGLFLNAGTLGESFQSTPTSSLTPTKCPHPPRNPPRFQSLQRLSMGVSPIADPIGVALFLSSLCPPDCQVESGVTWDEKVFIGPEATRSVRIRCERWEKVEEMLPGMVELRTQERARSSELERENRDLKIRNSVLLDKLGLSPKKETTDGADDSCLII